ncbi:MAG: transglycosylase domain-containing protein [Spirochaetales bacterium]|nr:transglycosylase domain-containing protein [Spirochaetales bacterium]
MKLKIRHKIGIFIFSSYLIFTSVRLGLLLGAFTGFVHNEERNVPRIVTEDYTSITDLPPQQAKIFIFALDDRHYNIGKPNKISWRIKSDAVYELPLNKKTITSPIYKALYTFPVQKVRSNQEILDSLLSRTYFGHGCYGIDSASYFFFNKPSTELSVEEFSLLCLQLSAPGVPSPFSNKALAQESLEEFMNSLVNTQIIAEQEILLDKFWKSHDFTKEK